MGDGTVKQPGDAVPGPTEAGSTPVKDEAVTAPPAGLESSTEPGPAVEATSTPAAPVQPDEIPTAGETVRQLLYALPMTIAAVVFTFGIWLLFAYMRQRWTQISVFTAGMVAPLVLYKCTTMRRKMGKKVWPKAPHPLWMAVVSTSVMLLFTPLFEYLAYVITFRNELYPSFSNFTAKYFGIGDWILIACGFGLSFVFPFFLKIGERWPWPRRKGKG
jgi:hypothetical protein